MIWLVIVVVVVLLVLWSRADSDVTTMMFASRVKSGYFTDKIVWITGASAGIGAELAVALTQYGAKVVLSARREDDLRKVAARCVGKHRPIVFVLDVLQMANHEQATKQVMELAGGPIDVLVLNAGRSQRATAVDADMTTTIAITELNVFAPISMTKAVLPHMMARKSGQIVVVSSVAAKVCSSLISSYSLTKAAVNAYFDALRSEVARNYGIRVNVIMPGPVDTDVISNAFTNNISGSTGYDPATESELKMTAARCAELICRSMSEDVYESWISRQPILTFVYISQYLPTLYRIINTWAGPARIRAFQKGGTDGNSLGTLFRSSSSSPALDSSSSAHSKTL